MRIVLDKFDNQTEHFNLLVEELVENLKKYDADQKVLQVFLKYQDQSFTCQLQREDLVKNLF